MSKTTHKQPLKVLFEDRNWLVVNKPPYTPTTAPERVKVQSLVDLVHEYLGEKSVAHPLSRLDIEVTGAVLFAKTDRAIKVGTRVKEEGKYKRNYCALVSPAPKEKEGKWSWPIGTNPSDITKRIADGGKDQKNAVTNYYVDLVGDQAAQIHFVLETGRTHQIRVHCQKAGNSILGDTTYGGLRHLTLSDGSRVTAKRVMLHLFSVKIPETDQTVSADLPEDYMTLGNALSIRW